MNKMDMLRNMQETSATHAQPQGQPQSQAQIQPLSQSQRQQDMTELSEENLQRLEAQIRVQCLQDEAKIKNTQELIQLLKKLQTAISQAARDVDRAAQQVKDYPDNAVARYAVHFEKCLVQCEAAARRAKANYDATQSALGVLTNQYLYIIGALALLTSVGAGFGIIVLPRLIFG